MRRTRMELWLLLAAVANRRALELAGKCGDADTIIRLARATEAMTP